MKNLLNNKTLIIRIAFAALIFFLFLPMVSVSAFGASVGAYSGWNLISGNFLMILLLLMPIGVLVVSFVQSLKKYESLAAIIASILGFILLLVATSGSGNYMGLVGVGVGAGWILSLLAYLAVLGLFIYHAVMKSKNVGSGAGTAN
jgi:hypothetical protein